MSRLLALLVAAPMVALAQSPPSGPLETPRVTLVDMWENSATAAEAIRKMPPGEARTRAEGFLKDKIQGEFAERQATQRAEVQRLEAELAKVKARVEQREKLAEQIVARRVAELLGDDATAWDVPPPARPVPAQPEYYPPPTFPSGVLPDAPPPPVAPAPASRTERDWYEREQAARKTAFDFFTAMAKPDLVKVKELTVMPFRLLDGTTVEKVEEAVEAFTFPKGAQGSIQFGDPIRGFEAYYHALYPYTDLDAKLREAGKALGERPIIIPVKLFVGSRANPGLNVTKSIAFWVRFVDRKPKIAGLGPVPAERFALHPVQPSPYDAIDREATEQPIAAREVAMKFLKAAGDSDLAKVKELVALPFYLADGKMAESFAIAAEGFALPKGIKASILVSDPRRGHGDPMPLGTKWMIVPILIHYSAKPGGEAWPNRKFDLWITFLNGNAKVAGVGPAAPEEKPVAVPVPPNPKAIKAEAEKAVEEFFRVYNSGKKDDLKTVCSLPFVNSEAQQFSSFEELKGLSAFTQGGVNVTIGRIYNDFDQYMAESLEAGPWG